jgi:uncharacterized protein (TIGR03067 family)
MTKAIAAIAVALFVALPVNSEESKTGFDPAKILGPWKIVSGMRGGEKVSDEGLKTKVVIEKETISLGTGEMKFVIGYKIDAKAKPATIDMSIKSGPINEGKAIGIIALDKNGFKLCYVVAEGSDTKRPTKFESTKENKAALFVLEPEKK